MDKLPLHESANKKVNLNTTKCNFLKNKIGLLTVFVRSLNTDTFRLVAQVHH